MKYIIILICLVQLMSCKSEDQQRIEATTSKVNSLSDNDEKRDYLESIFDDHIELRLSETEAWNAYGRNSDEYEALVSKQRSADLILAEKINIYLNTYGYPSIMKLGQKAAVIPIAHITYVNDEKLLSENFNYFHDAFVFNDITEDLFYDYLIKLLRIGGDERRSLFREYNQTEVVAILLERAKEKNY